jgi:glycosyltransferase involved in cell wall biosynthesis
MTPTDRPRVLLLTQVLPYPPDSGPKVKTWNLIKCLARDYELTLVSFVRGDQAADALHLARHCAAVWTVPLRRGLVNDLWSLARSLVERQPFVMVRDDRAVMRRLVARLSAGTRFDVVHADQLNMAQYAARVPGARKVLDAHNALWLLYKRLWHLMPRGVPRALLGRDWRLLRAYEGEVCLTFDAVVAVNDEDRSALEEVAPAVSRITVLPIAIDTDELRPLTRDPGANHIVYVGTMYWPPNRDAVLWFVRDVYPRIRAVRPDVVFDVIGARPGRRIRGLTGDAASIRVTGYVADPTPYLERAGAVIVPLRAGGGMRVKILTALAQGLPVVSTSLGCTGLAVESGQHLLIADTAEDFAQAALRVLGDRQLASQLARNGRVLVETRYDYRVVGPRLRAWYHDVVRGVDPHRSTHLPITTLGS